MADEGKTYHMDYLAEGIWMLWLGGLEPHVAVAPDGKRIVQRPIITKAWYSDNVVALAETAEDFARGGATVWVSNVVQTARGLEPAGIVAEKLEVA